MTNFREGWVFSLFQALESVLVTQMRLAIFQVFQILLLRMVFSLSVELMAVLDLLRIETKSILFESLEVNFFSRVLPGSIVDIVAH
jgi:hypothetical protein